MKSLFVSAPTPRPGRAAAVLAAAMAHRGHEVHWVGKDHYAYLLEAGVAFRSLPADLDLDITETCDSFETPHPDRVADLAEALLAPTTEIMRETAPDVVICDTDAVWGAISADGGRIPLASYSSGLFVASPERIRFLEEATRPAAAVNWCRRSFASDVRLHAERRLNRLRASLGLPAVMNLDRVFGEVHLLFTTRFFEFAGAGLPDKVRCIGPVFRWPEYRSSALCEASGKDGRVVFVHWLSSMPDAASRLEEIHAAVQGAGLASVIETDLPDSDIPAGTERPASPLAHAAILRRAAAVICTGDFDAVHEALSWGVPVIVMPCTQRGSAVGLRVEELGLGRVIAQGSGGASRLQQTLDTISEDESLARRVGEFALQARMTDAGRGVRVLEALAAHGTVPRSLIDGGQVNRFPEYPRMGRHVRCVPLPAGGMSIGSYLEQFTVADEKAARALARTWSMLDGTMSVGDLIDAWQADEDILQLLDWLAQRGLLEEGAGRERISHEDIIRYGPQISLFAHATGGGVQHPRLGGPAFQEKLLNARVGVFGAGALGSAVVRHLALTGVGELHLVGQGTVDDSLINRGGWFGPGDTDCDRLDALTNKVRALRPQTRVVACTDAEARLEHLDLVIVAEDDVDPRHLRDIGRRCHEAPVAWISLRPDRWNVEIGPTVVPGMTACFECYEARRTGALAADTHRRPDGAPMDAGHLNVPLGTELLAVEVIKLLTGFGDVATIDHVLVLSPMQMTFTSHPVLRLPSCPRCRGNRGLARESVWRDDINA